MSASAVPEDASSASAPARSSRCNAKIARLASPWAALARAMSSRRMATCDACRSLSASKNALSSIFLAGNGEPELGVQLGHLLCAKRGIRDLADQRLLRADVPAAAASEHETWLLHKTCVRPRRGLPGEYRPRAAENQGWSGGKKKRPARQASD